ncbi:MAG: SDR family NAD(P)-dependent oxidoreductase [Aulosira sp. DedQUE10]|nr:SDR family NAD(P)-dependent oxidoreductase [Aulosira sp. DedQUE10]
MKTSGNEVLITGGATGIGFALADAFLRAGNQVVICGRRMDKLDEASACLPGIKTSQADISTPEGRSALITYSLAHLPNLNLLVNNAGISQLIELSDTHASELEEKLRSEVEIDCIAPIVLATQLLPHLKQQPSAAIVNVTTALVFAPNAAFPFYAVAKAGLRAFTQSLRFQLQDSHIKVFEVIPPMVDTALSKSAGSKITAKRVAFETLKGIERDRFEIKVGKSKSLALLSRISPSFAYSVINGRN